MCETDRELPSKGDFLLLQYETVNDRRAATDGMLWQAPSLCLTAQAFLFQIALGDLEDTGAVMVSMGMAFISSIAAIHLMLKHRFFEERDSRFAEKIEETVSAEFRLNSHAEVPSMGSTVDVWICTLVVFGGIAAATFSIRVPDAIAGLSGKPFADSYLSLRGIVSAVVAISLGSGLLAWAQDRRSKVKREIDRIFPRRADNPSESRARIPTPSA